MSNRRQLRPGTLTWARFDRYVVDNGVLRPAEGAHCERYEPWDDYPEPREGAPPAPHQSVCTLLAALRWRNDARGEPVLDEPSEQRLLGWCARYGLLGVLLEDLERVESPARWETDRSPAARRELLATVRTYRHDGDGWRESVAQQSPSVRRKVDRTMRREAGRLVPAHLLLERWNHPGVHLHNTETGEVWVAPVDHPQLRPFFRAGHSLADAVIEPASPRFWEVYGEPIVDFVRRADAIRIALEAMREGDPSPLNRLAAHNRHAIVMDNGRPTPRWTSRSLIGAMAAMAMQGLVDGGVVLVCVGCQAMFVSSAYQARYCSPRCRNRTTQRNFRERAKKVCSTNEEDGDG